MGRASKDKRDIYYRKAKEEGFRARSAYKLLQINEDFNILSDTEITTGAVDLCAAPGSWSQVLAEHFRAMESRQARAGAAGATGPPPLRPRIVAVDLQEMAPIDGVTIVQGDITSEATARAVMELLNAPEVGSDAASASKRPRTETAEEEEEEEEEVARAAPAPAARALRKADIVVCDGAPDVTGMHELDEYLQHQLLLAALTITTSVLRPGGCFVTKMFRGPNTPFLVARSEMFFSQVRVVKPKSSRNASMESFLLCQQFRLPAGYVPRFLSSSSSSSSTATATATAAAATAAGGVSTGSLLSSSAVEQTAAASQASEAYGFTPDAPAYGYAQSTHRADDDAVSQQEHRKKAEPQQPQQPQQLGQGQGQAVFERYLLPFLSCGDLSGLDADMCYDRDGDGPSLAPVQPPLEAPYLPRTTEKRI